MYTTIGSCPKCGAPIYTYSAWNGVTPPPSIHSCYCAARPTITTTDRTQIEIKGSLKGGHDD